MTSPKSARCLNIGNCSIASSMQVLQLQLESELACPECGKSLQLVTSKQSRKLKINSSSTYIAGALVVIAGTLFFTTILGRNHIFKNLLMGSSQKYTSFQDTGSIQLRLVGSNTIGSKLAPALIKGFFENKGCLNVIIKETKHDELKVSCETSGKNMIATIVSKGSSMAFNALSSGEADIGMSSRRIKPNENQVMVRFGDLTAPGSEHVIALDGLAIIVHPSNMIEKLSTDEVRSIFSNPKISSKSLNPKGGLYNIYRRNDKSGTFDSFKSSVMKGLPINSDAKEFEDSRELSSEVSNDPKGIGFVGFTHIRSAKAIPIGGKGQNALLPTRFTIATEDYPLSRRLYFYTLPSSKNPAISEFLSFTLSAKGESIIESNNFVPLSIVKQKPTSFASNLTGYNKIVQYADRLSVNFRFRSGSDQLDNKALMDLDRITKYLISTSTPASKLLLIGFADSTGDKDANIALSRLRARTVANALQTRGIIPGSITGFGADNPVASNATIEGQQKNRRVEVWVNR
jgi:phosphate transport system substrate-binding protein